MELVRANRLVVLLICACMSLDPVLGVGKRWPSEYKKCGVNKEGVCQGLGPNQEDWNFTEKGLQNTCSHLEGTKPIETGTANTCSEGHVCCGVIKCGADDRGFCCKDCDWDHKLETLPQKAGECDKLDPKSVSEKSPYKPFCALFPK